MAACGSGKDLKRSLVATATKTHGHRPKLRMLLRLRAPSSPSLCPASPPSTPDKKRIPLGLGGRGGLRCCGCTLRATRSCGAARSKATRQVRKARTRTGQGPRLPRRSPNLKGPKKALDPARGAGVGNQEHRISGETPGQHPPASLPPPSADTPPKDPSGKLWPPGAVRAGRTAKGLWDKSRVPSLPSRTGSRVGAGAGQTARQEGGR